MLASGNDLVDTLFCNCEDIDNFKDAERIDKKNGNKPDFFTAASGKPKCPAFPSKHPGKRDDRKETDSKPKAHRAAAKYIVHHNAISIPHTYYVQLDENTKYCIVEVNEN